MAGHWPITTRHTVRSIPHGQQPGVLSAQACQLEVLGRSMGESSLLGWMTRGPESDLTHNDEMGGRRNSANFTLSMELRKCLRGWQLQPAPGPPRPVPAEQGSIVCTDFRHSETKKLQITNSKGSKDSLSTSMKASPLSPWQG